MSSTPTHEAIDRLIKEGNFPSAIEALESISPSNLDRDQSLLCANFARRLQKPLMSLKFLRKQLLDYQEGLGTMTSQELNVYVSSLIKLGAYGEAERWIKQSELFGNVDLAEVKGRLALHLRDYEKAVENYQKLISTREEENYAYLVDLVNLAASLISLERNEEALNVLQKALKLAIAFDSRILCGNIQELFAQTYINLKQFDKAESSLDESKKSLKATDSVYGFYVKKWRFFLDGKRQKADKQNLYERYQTLTKEAQSKLFYEDHRDFDRFCGIEFKSIELVRKVFYGTPYEKYRQPILKAFPNLDFTSPMLFNFHDNQEPLPVVETPEVSQLGEKAEILFQLLLSDFYRPISVGTLFDKLYGGESFDPHHSPKRVYQNILRLRELLDKAYPLQIIWKDNSAQLLPTASCKILVTSPHGQAKTPRSPFIEAVAKEFNKEWFSRKELEEKLQLKRRTAQRKLQEAVSEGLLSEKGSVKSRKYSLK